MTASEIEAKGEEIEMPTWAKVYDPASTEYYFYNNYTGECVWEQPEDYKEINYSLLMMMAKNSKSELWASLLVQKTWRAKKARGDVRTVRAEQAAEGSDELWTAVLDPGSGEYYCPSSIFRCRVRLCF